MHNSQVPEKTLINCDQKTLNEATAQIQTFRADFGGTYGYEPIEASFKVLEKEASRTKNHIFLITDGQFWGSRISDLINLAEKKRKYAVVHVIGMGDSCSSHEQNLRDQFKKDLNFLNDLGGSVDFASKEQLTHEKFKELVVESMEVVEQARVHSFNPQYEENKVIYKSKTSNFDIDSKAKSCSIQEP